mgnify:CR=1
MKKLKNFKYAIMLVISFFAIDGYAQITPIDMTNTGGRVRIRSRIPNANAIPYEPYLNMDARMTTLQLLEGDSLQGFFKYNVETESLESAQGDKIYTYRDVRWFRFEKTADLPEESFINIRLVWPVSEYGGFFKNVIGSDYVKVKYYLDYLEADYDPKMDVGNRYDRVEMAKEFYVKINNEWTAIPQRRNPFLDKMSQYTDEKDLKKFIRKNNLDLDEGPDIAKIIDYIAANAK